MNSQGTEVQLEASVHQFYGEPLLSAFEQQVAEQGIGMVMASRALDNALEEGKGALDAGIEFVEGIWNLAVDIDDIIVQVAKMDTHWRLGEGYLEHNATQEGLGRAMDATGNYIADTVMLKKSWSELGNDIKGAGESLIDPFVKVSEDEGNWLTRNAEESYNAGYNQVKAGERAVDIVGAVKGAAQLTKNIGDMSKSPSSVHGESGGGKSAGGDGKSGGRPVITPQWNHNLHEAAKSLGGDGKFKTNALRLPLDIASLESFMQSLANRMNIFSKRLVPVGFGKISNGRPRWEFEDYSRMDSNGRGGSGGGPDKPPKDHHEDERKRREDETEGTGKPPKRYGEPPSINKLKIDLKAEKKANEVRDWSYKDVQEFSRNTGLNLQDANDLLSHMFLKEYDLPWYDDKGLYYYKSKLTPDSEVVFAFHKAIEGELTLEQKKWFIKLKEHELEEKKLMEMGKDYRNPNAWNGKDGFNPYPPGAHELAPEQPKFGTFPGYTNGLNKFYGIKVGEEWDEL